MVLDAAQVNSLANHVHTYMNKAADVVTSLQPCTKPIQKDTMVNAMVGRAGGRGWGADLLLRGEREALGASLLQLM